MLFAIPFPTIDPIIFELGPLSIRWYALAYLLGIFVGWRVMRYMNQISPIVEDNETIDDFLVWVTLGILLGGRVGYVLFYNLNYYIQNPLNIFAIWHGGMSFHGGFAGVTISSIAFCKKRRVNILNFGDAVCVVAPIGLFFGRIANFINGELFGRPSSVPWAVIFPNGGNIPRHPSQLYEAIFEGALLFFLLWFLFNYYNPRKRPGVLTGVFLLSYGIIRGVIEFFREPDFHIGYLGFGIFTMGQLLSLPMILVGAILIFNVMRKESLN
ncbi:MAG: prolipoprotein diacylglyceryl transferase [Magnetovibrio sp.]|nr:prolipoprotein diacylglyceryl transferase [Magnetovibrio sp.]